MYCIYTICYGINFSENKKIASDVISAISKLGQLETDFSCDELVSISKSGSGPEMSSVLHELKEEYSETASILNFVSTEYGEGFAPECQSFVGEEIISFDPSTTSKHVKELSKLLLNLPDISDKIKKLETMIGYTVEPELFLTFGTS